MAGKDQIDIKVSAVGTEKLKADLKGTEKAVDKVGKSVEKTGKKTKETTGIFGKFSSGVLSWAGGLVSFTAAVALATKTILADIRNIEEAATKARGAIAAQRDLIFMGDFYKKHPNIQQELQSLAEQGRLGTGGMIQAARAYEMVQGKMPYASQQRITETLREILEYKRTVGPETSLGTLADLFVFMQQAAPEATVNQLQNVIQEAVTLGGAPTAAYPQFMTGILGTGKMAGLTVPETAALFATATRVEPEPSRAATALSRMINILRGKDVPEKAAKVLEGLGISQEMPLLEQYRRLYEGFQQGKVALPEISEVFGMYGGPLMAKMIPAYPSYMQTRGRLTEVFQRGGAEGLDLTASMLEDMRVSNEWFEVEEDIRLYETQKENIQFNLDAMKGLKLQRAQLKRYTIGRQRGIGHIEAAFDVWLNKWMLQAGIPEKLISYSEGEPARTPMPSFSDNSTNITNIINPIGDPNTQAQPLIESE